MKRRQILEPAMSPTKQRVINLLESLPDDCSLDDIQYHLYVLSKVEKSEERIKAGETLSQDEVKRRLAKWLET
jgi:hypothetical protein